MVSSMHEPFIYHSMSFEKHIVSTRAADLPQIWSSLINCGMGWQIRRLVEQI